MSEDNKDLGDEIKDTAKEFSEGAKQALQSGDNKKILVGVLAIVLGSIGVHKFLLGYKKEGFILLAVTVLGYATSCIGIGLILLAITGIVGLIEGIIYLTKSDEEFYNTYQASQKPWF